MIYFDHSATTPADKKVLKAMEPYWRENFGNPSSIHAFGQRAVLGVDRARVQAAEFFGCEREEIFFTSGATEANNLALRGIIKVLKNEIAHPHIITSKIEHDAIIEPCRDLESEGIEVTYLPVDKRGMVNPEDVKNAIKENTVLVSVMYVNSEVGIREPIREIGKIVEKINESRQNEWQRTGAAKKLPKPGAIYFHTDATQAVNFFDCHVKKLHVDLLSMSGHKIYGPKGVGLIYIKKGVKISPIQLGGHHERNIRSGTLNVTGIVGLGEALSLITEADKEKNNKKIAALRDRLVEGVMENIPDVVLNTDRENSTPAHAHLTLRGAEGESVLISLDFEGIAVSTGSACASNSLKSSEVLEAMGVSEEDSHYSIRFTLGKDNTAAEIDKVIKILPGIVEKLRKMNPVYGK
ncbi:MAG: cysteine desulfurase family protein [Patescibacteria group bacterium]|nr:cysteine desulfurase family protein [Patescibacteria group bacterium]